MAIFPLVLPNAEIPNEQPPPRREPRPARFQCTLESRPAWFDGEAEPDVVTTVQITITGKVFPRDGDWSTFVGELRRLWKSPVLYGPPSTPEEALLDQILSTLGPRPKPRKEGGRGLQAYWKRAFERAQAAGITREVEEDGRKVKRVSRWKSWLELRRFVLQREEAEHQRMLRFEKEMEVATRRLEEEWRRNGVRLVSV